VPRRDHQYRDQKRHTRPGSIRDRLSATSGFNNSDDLSSRISQSVSGGTDRVYGRLGISGEQNEAFYDGKGDQVFIDNTQTDLQYNRTLDLMGSLAIKLDDVQDLDLLAQYYDSGNNGSVGIYFPNLHDKAPSNLDDAQIRSGYDTDLEPRSKRLLFNANYHHSRRAGPGLLLAGLVPQGRQQFLSIPVLQRR
jgi:iron complex outermembrane recepter protein